MLIINDVDALVRLSNTPLDFVKVNYSTTPISGSDIVDFVTGIPVRRHYAHTIFMSLIVRGVTRLHRDTKKLSRFDLKEWDHDDILSFDSLEKLAVRVKEQFVY